jgi:hypothetical protein
MNEFVNVPRAGTPRYERRTTQSAPNLGTGLVMLILLLGLGIGSCGESEPAYVTVVADGQEQLLRITNPDLTVRDLLSTCWLPTACQW